MDTKDYVLGKLDQESNQIIQNTIEKFPQILDDYLSMSFDNLMNKYNG